MRRKLRHTVTHYKQGYQSWVLTMLVALLGALLRMVRLGQPRSLVFDETYYVKDAWSMLQTGEPRNWPESTSVDALFAQGDTNQWLNTAEYVVHPPMGKWCIALGLQLFGGASNPFAWRAASAVAGVIGIVLLMRIALRLFHNMSIAVLCGVLMAIDGVSLTMSRTGLLDIFIMVLALGALSLLLIHRDWALARLRTSFANDCRSRHARWHVASDGSMLLDASGPVLAFSWWRCGAIVLLGLATGVKWSGTYLFAVYMTISVLWDAVNRCTVGYRGWFCIGVLRDGLLTLCYAVPLYAVMYLADWISWFIHPDAYMRHAVAGSAWKSFLAYHQQMWQFHTTLDAPHPYQANPLTWPLQIRPTSFYWQKIQGHPGLCAMSPHSQCVSVVTSLGNPLIWWLGSLCAIAAIGITLFRHGDWRIWAVLAGFLGGWLPWAQYLHRTTFTFYSIVLLPWMILAIAYVYDFLRARLSHTIYLGTLGITLGLCTLVSVYFYPIWTAMPVPYEFWLSHMWLESWI